ncbi:hypothetical protein HDU83_008489, partial [Entophlyctis luteolus]
FEEQVFSGGANSTDFTLTDVNGDGVAVGVAVVNGVTVSELIINGTIADIAFPGATSTKVVGINDEGIFVGSAQDANGIFGFIGVYPTNFTKVVYPNSTSENELVDVNNNFEALGFYVNSVNQSTFYIFTFSTITKRDGGSFADFTLNPSSGITYAAGSLVATGLNDNGDVVGYFVVNGKTVSFLQKAGGEVLLFDFPGSSYTRINAINDNDEVVGQTGFNGSDFGFYAFSPSDFHLLNVTNALGVNNAGEIAGTNVNGSASSGVLLKPSATSPSSTTTATITSTTSISTTAGSGSGVGNNTTTFATTSASVSTASTASNADTCSKQATTSTVAAQTGTATIVDTCSKKESTTTSVTGCTASSTVNAAASTANYSPPPAANTPNQATTSTNIGNEYYPPPPANSAATANGSPAGNSPASSGYGANTGYYAPPPATVTAAVSSQPPAGNIPTNGGYTAPPAANTGSGYYAPPPATVTAAVTSQPPAGNIPTNGGYTAPPAANTGSGYYAPPPATATGAVSSKAPAANIPTNGGYTAPPAATVATGVNYSAGPAANSPANYGVSITDTVPQKTVTNAPAADTPKNLVSGAMKFWGPAAWAIHLLVVVLGLEFLLG